MVNFTTKKIVLNGLMIALVFLTTFLTRFPGPIPPGYINLGDVAIFVAALVLGPVGGFVAGAFGSALADAVAGAFIFVPVTFIVKGLEGFIAGLFISRALRSQNNRHAAVIAGVIAGAAVMVLGYFAAEVYILGLFDNTFGYTAAAAELPMNLVQGGVSAVAGYILNMLLIKVNIKKLA